MADRRQAHGEPRGSQRVHDGWMQMGLRSNHIEGTEFPR